MKAKITDRKPENGNRELKNEKKKEMGTEIKVKNRLIHQCNQCQMIFKSNYSLKTHEISVHDSKKAFHCTDCPTKFTNSGNLKMHMMIHTGEKNFVCNICEYKCNRSDSLKKHIAIAHEGKLLRGIDAFLGATPPRPSEISMKN